MMTTLFDLSLNEALAIAIPFAFGVSFWTLAVLHFLDIRRARRTDDLMSRQMARSVHLESRALCQGWRRG